MNVDSKPFLLAITACTAGVAHTYMAAEALRKAADAAGATIRVETQGTLGIEDRITEEEAAKAVAIIFAHDVAIKEIDRFEGIPTVDVSAAAAIKEADGLVAQALTQARDITADVAPVVSAPKETPAVASQQASGLSAAQVAMLVRDAVLTGISHVIPLIIAGGMIAAFCTIITQACGLQALAAEPTSWIALFKSLGSGGLGVLMVPILSAYMAFSLADKPGLAPGLIGGLAANTIASGFLGGMLSGLIAGFLMRWMKQNVKPAGPARTFVTFWVYPVLGSAITGALVLFVAGPPVAALNQWMISFLDNLSGTNAILLGALVGAMVSFDLGGPVNKAAYAFCVGAMANGNLVPYCIFASVKMVSAFSCTAACLLRPQLFSEEERQIGEQTWLLGLAGITEGAIPFAMGDPVRVISSFVAGSLICGGLVGFFNIGLSVPGAGIFSLIALSGGSSPVMAGVVWFGAALIGAAVSTFLLIVTRAHRRAHGGE